MTHPKFLRLKRRLKLPTWGAAGLLETLWHFVAIHCPDGAIGARFSNEDIANFLDWEDDPDLLVSALTESGWLDPHDEYRLVVHDWAVHCPNFVKGNMRKHGKTIIKTEFSDEAAKHGAKHGAKQAAKQPAKQAANEAAKHGATKTNTNTKTNTQEEKTEESAEPPSGVQHPPEGSALLVFPTRGTRPFWSLTQAQVDDWAGLYPGLDILAECRKALAWCKAHPTKQKTAQGTPAFLTAWFNRAADRPAPQSPRPTYQPRTATPSPTVTERMGGDLTAFLFGTPEPTAKTPDLALEVRTHG